MKVLYYYHWYKAFEIKAAVANSRYQIGHMGTFCH